MAGEPSHLGRSNIGLYRSPRAASELRGEGRADSGGAPHVLLPGTVKPQCPAGGQGAGEAALPTATHNMGIRPGQDTGAPPRAGRRAAAADAVAAWAGVPERPQLADTAVPAGREQQGARGAKPCLAELRRELHELHAMLAEGVAYGGLLNNIIRGCTKDEYGV